VSVLKHVFRRLSPAGERARLSILIFHRVLGSHDPLLPDVPDAAAFDRILDWMSSWFNLLPLDRAVALLASAALPERAVAITFDDGYADNCRVALPLLRRHGASATFFIATGYLDGGRMWNDTVIEAVREAKRPTLDLREIGLGAHAVATIDEKRIAIDALLRDLKYRPSPERLALCGQLADIVRATLPDDLMLTSRELVELRDGGMQIGAHTSSHPILANVADDDARREIAASRSTLEAILQERVGLFAYPNGKRGSDYLPRHVAMVRELGFDAAVSTQPGVACAATDPMELPRFTPWDRGRTAFGVRLGMNARHPVAQQPDTRPAAA
jgi:peptidoglycan/xylan/chitin deacetylase (PgdA/CDA1 family)